MKILHVMLSAFYIDNYSYQENLLPKYHKSAGHEVEIVASLFTFDENGKGMWLPQAKKYINENDIPVTRLDFKSSPFSKRLRIYRGFYDELERFAPDIIFLHGVSFCDVAQVAKYAKRHPHVRVFADNHTDFINSGRNWVSKHIQHGILWRSCAKKILPYTEKFYGVLPARVDFLIDVYKVPKDKVELLVMGADDDSADAVTESDIVSFRKEYGIANSDILITTAGKIDNNKKEILLLMKAVRELNKENVKLLVFGSVVPEFKDDFDRLVDGKQVIYGGWLKTEDTYKCFRSTDLMAFPGLHSVYWEQAVGCGCACIFRKIDGFTHIDMNGNCKFFKDITLDGIKNTVNDIVNDPHIISDMKSVAEENQYKFRYSHIAQISIEDK